MVYHIERGVISVFFDCHTHTIHSDGKDTVPEMCVSAIEKGIRGLTITDHADMNFYMERNTFRRIAASMGSDAHNRNNVARSFTEAAVLLKTCGFDSVYYFENRKPKKIMLEKG